MIFSQSKKKIINQAVENSQRQMGLSALNIFRKAAIDQFKMENHFRNLQNPLEYLRNNTIQGMINQTTNLSSKLQNQMSETTEFSKNIYKEVISNEDYLKFFNDQMGENDSKRNRVNMEQILEMQKRLKENARKKSQNPQRQVFFQKPNIKIDNLKQKKNQQVRHSRHPLSRDKQNIQDSQNQEIKYDHIKKLNTPLFDKQCRHVQFYNMLKQSDLQVHKAGNQEFNIEKNQTITKMMDQIKFPLIKDSTEYDERSKDLYVDLSTNLSFWIQAPGNKDIYLNEPYNISEGKNIPPQDTLKHFIGLKIKNITANNIYDVAMKKITPDRLSSYYKLKSQHYEILQRQKRDDGLDQRYHVLLKQYELAQQKRTKDQSRKMPTRIINTQTQTINLYQGQQTHKFFQNYQSVESILLKLRKLNVVRERAMKSYKQKSNRVILKNICLQIDEILFKLILLMLKGQNLFFKNQNSQPNRKIPIFTCSDLINVKNKQQVQRKILELIHGNYDKFQIQKVDGILKKTIIQVYVQQRQKNNKVYDILQR